jgi:hypothetical protein
VWRQLRHRHVHPLLGLYQEPENTSVIYGVSEYCRFETLYHFVHGITSANMTLADRYSPADDCVRLVSLCRPVLGHDSTSLNLAGRGSRRSCLSPFAQNRALRLETCALITIWPSGHRSNDMTSTTLLLIIKRGHVSWTLVAT